MKNKLHYVIGGFVMLFAVLLYFDVLKPIELKLQDQWLQEERAVDSRIVILAIDDTSLHAIGQWPWARDVHAELVETLGQHPAVIGFDITFPLPSAQEADDAAFIEAVREANNVVLARYGVFDQYATRGMMESRELSEPFSPLKEQAAALGHLNTMPDSDGVVRQSLYEFAFDGESIRSFSAVIAEQYATRVGMPFEVDESALNDYRQFHIAYAGKPGDFEVIPYSYVLEGQVDPTYFTNRIVLIGPYTVGIKDDFLTPMSGKQNMFGVEIHANIIQQMLDGNYKQSITMPWTMLLLVIGGMIVYIAYRALSPLLSFLLILLLTIALLFVSKVLYTNGWLMSIVYLLGLFIVSYIGSVVYNYIQELTERKRVTTIFGRYVAPQVVSQILQSGEEGLKLGGSRKDVTVMFVDIRGFTPLSESVEPEEIVAILNDYLNLTASCIFQYGGTLDKFIGDATMAIYNAPLPLENHPLQAVKTAYAMKQGAEELEKMLFERYGKSVRFGIGIHCGPAVVGNIGSDNHMDYTAIGDTVNTAARLESNAKPGQIILSEALYERVKDDVHVTSLGEIFVKGKTQGIQIYELEGIDVCSEKN